MSGKCTQINRENGDTFLARLFSRIPEEYIGVISCKDDDDEQLKRLEHFRALRKQHFDLLMKLDAMTKEAAELKIKDAVQLASISAKISSSVVIGLPTPNSFSCRKNIASSSRKRCSNSLASLIADAILHDPQVVQLVALSDDNCLEMKKDWELMSELDKDALVRKKIILEL